MADKSAVRRKLFVHPAHRVVGVSGDSASLHPYCRIADVPTHGLLSAATHLALVARKRDADAWAAVALFDQATAERDNVDCSRVDLDAVDADLARLADADCVALFERGLHIARHWSDLAFAVQAEDNPAGDCPNFRVSENGTVPLNAASPLAEGDREEMRVELAVATRRHPVLEGVTPFVFHAVSRGVCIPQDATVLLTGSRVDQIEPVAWVRHCRHGRVFHTSLGTSEHFRHPEFVRLVLNGLAWVAGQDFGPAC